MATGVIGKDSIGRITLPTVLEVYKCDNETGSLVAVPIGGCENERDFEAAYNALCKESPGELFIKVKCVRRIADANFNWKNYFKDRML